MTAIFISHSSRDDAAAAELRWLLEGQGHRSVFLDFDPVDGIPAGRDWERELYQQLRSCHALIVLASEHSMSSRWCFAEITHAKSMGKPIFPIKVGPCEIDPVLTSRQVIDLTRAASARPRPEAQGSQGRGDQGEPGGDGQRPREAGREAACRPRRLPSAAARGPGVPQDEEPADPGTPSQHHLDRPDRRRLLPARWRKELAERLRPIVRRVARPQRPPDNSPIPEETSPEAPIPDDELPDDGPPDDGTPDEPPPEEAEDDEGPPSEPSDNLLTAPSTSDV